LKRILQVTLVFAGSIVVALIAQIYVDTRIREELCLRLKPFADCEVNMEFGGGTLEINPNSGFGIATIHGRVDSLLFRDGCRDGWSVGGTLRLEPFSAQLGAASLAIPKTCVDVSTDGLYASVVGVTIESGACMVGLDEAQLEWKFGEMFQADVAATITENRICGMSLPMSAPIGIHIDSTFDGDLIAELELADSPTQEEPLLSLPRSILNAMSTRHTITLSATEGDVDLHLATRRAEPSGSPGIVLSGRAPAGLTSKLPEEFRAFLADQEVSPDDCRGRIEWTLDHDSGQAIVNCETVSRIPQALVRHHDDVLECNRYVDANRPTLLFVEANDYGDALDPSQLQRVFDTVDASLRDDGALIAVFVHGWNHSAAKYDSYVCGFSAILDTVSDMESKHSTNRPRRDVIGVYVGWPGRLYDSELLNQTTTFWNRLRSADALGKSSGAAHTLIAGLSERVEASDRSDMRADRRSALVLAGHSMGARAVYHSLSEPLASDSESGGYVADLAVLINPALSASIFRQVHKSRLLCDSNLMPLFLFSSEHDVVTRAMFPAGQTVTYPLGRTKPPPFLEYVYTAANFPEFVTHRLDMIIMNGTEPPDPDGEHTVTRGFKRVPQASARTEFYNYETVNVYRQPTHGFPTADDVWYSMVLKEKVPQTCGSDNATKVIEVDQRILPNHGMIFTPPFLEYLIRLVNHSLKGSATQP